MNLAPIPYSPTGTVYGVLLNFQGECAAMAARMTQPPYQAAPRAPVLYIKTANTWSANGADIAVPRSVAEVEVGATIAMVLGPGSTRGQGPSAAPAVASYVLMNDLSVPHSSFFRPPVKFKCLDGFLGIGARLVLAAQATGAMDPALFKLHVHINGSIRQSVDFSCVVRSAAQLLADVGEFMTLREGDVLMLGCDIGRPLAKVGDRIEISAPDWPAFGSLSNTLIAQAT